MALTLVIVGLGLAASVGGAHCPNIDNGESPQDCPWAAFGRRLTREADRGRDIGPLFNKLAPGLVKQLRADAQRPDWHELWTASVNRDENTGATLVDPRILRVLGGLMGIAIDDLERTGAVHAGLQHTYGFLFSLAPAPEYRRARWVRGTIEAGFGLPKGVLGPLPPSGTLFSNATYFFGRLALADSETAMAVLRQPASIPQALRDFAFAEVKIKRLEERVRVPQVSGREIVLRTDVIAFTQSTPVADHLLIYSWFDPSDGRTRLVTGLPVANAVVESLLSTDNLGDDIMVNSRYDGYIEGLTGAVEPFSGSRHVISIR